MDIKIFLDKVCNEIRYKPVRKEIAEELENHIDELKEIYIEKGFHENQAEEKAIEQMGKAEEIGKKLNKIHKPKLDWKLLILIIILIGYGVTISILKQSLNNTYIQNTIIHIVIGSILGIIIYFLDYRKIKKYSNLIYILATIIMILPFIGVRNYFNGIPYMNVFGIGFFPSMITLPLYILSFIGVIVDYNDKMKIYNKKEKTINKDFIKLILMAIFSLLLFIKTNSTANAMILAITYIIITTIKIIQVNKNKLRNLLILYGSIIIVPIILLTITFGEIPTNLNKGAFRFNRILVSFSPEIDPQGAGYTGMLQKEILENAKLIGETQTDVISNEQFIINQDSNFTFIYLLGKTGIIPAVTLVITIILTSIKLIINAKNIKEQYGKYIIIGLSSIYIIQSLASVLMNINLGIKTNIDLPFVTYGGVYFIVNIISISIILSVYRRKDINVYDKNNVGIIGKIGEVLLDLDKKINNVSN